jgi:hypothetical protein
LLCFIIRGSLHHLRVRLRMEPNWLHSIAA